MDLFDATPGPRRRPLADVLRPTSLDEIIGQQSLVAKGSLLRRRIAANALGSLILFGPPGIGKTSIARAIGNTLGKEFRVLHAAGVRVQDIRKIADEARMKPILMFVDEVHRLSATQADDLLTICEEGTTDFIGATTENPFHSIPKALISRSQVLKLEPLSPGDMTRVIERGLAHLAAQGLTLEMTAAQKAQIAGRSGGDARRALTTLESLSLGHDCDHVTLTDAMIEEAFAAAPVAFDRQGDQHYDVMSAFIKSMRGSDPDATLYWLAVLVHAGEDPRFVARRIMIHASEDVGLADNTALQTAVAAAEAVERIGYPEAQIILAHAALHIARAPKSNAACRGIGAALSHVRAQGQVTVPLHLRDAHYAGAKTLGHVGYRFPHADPRGWVEQEYTIGIPRGAFYQSDAREAATFEKRADQHWNDITGRRAVRTFDD
ncbi:replication-associated recombination protein A [Sagittula salina]|uniref:Replication-associated recombination protein A n=1 Tax=Sagittula salina TaxID=2820268 RepID=A0A940MN63_9RHOB|nr:replication-associated recombination protein A [Sagittula salina]MBP0482805.1 replication-associated recombination protein A [Sagittula salina]